MKKILYVLPVFDVGGAERASMLVANELVDKWDYRAAFFTFSRGEFNRNLLHGNIDVVKNNIFNNTTRLTRMLSTYIVIPFCLVRYLNRTRYDIVVSTFELGPEIPVLIVAFLYRIFRRSSKIRFVSVLQNVVGNIARSTNRNKLVMSIISLARQWLFADIIVVSKEIVNDVHHSRKRNVHLIQNPVHIAFTQQRARESLDCGAEFVLDKPFFINVARISHQKNQMGLVKAFETIKNRIIENMLIIGQITEERYLQELQQYIQQHNLGSRVYCLGVLDNHFPLVQKATAFVFSSVYEGFPLAILEAMALRSVVISTKFKGYGELLTPYNALLVDHSGQLSQAMENVSLKNISTEEIVDNAFRTATLFDIKIIGEKYHRIFSKI